MPKDNFVAAVRQLDATLQEHLPEVPEVISPQEDEELYALQNDPRDGVTVYMRTVFLKVGDIDTIMEKFSANVFVQAKWLEPSLDNYPQDAVDKLDWAKMWSPKLYIDNLVGEPKQTIWNTVTFDDQGQATAYEKRRVKGSFMESMELNQFPFDTQDLTVVMASELQENDIYLHEDRSEASSVNTQSFIAKQEWSLGSHVEVTRKTQTSDFNNIRSKPIISSSCHARRRSGFYIWNILLIMLFICSMAFATFSVSLALPHFRLALSFTLILTTVAFKFSASQSLPKIPYLTLLDKYILVSLGILCIICAWHALIPILMVSQLTGKDNTTLSWDTKIDFDVSSIHPADLDLTLGLDRLMVYILLSGHIIFHIVFVIIIIVQSHMKKSKAAKKHKQHEEKLEATQKVIPPQEVLGQSPQS